MCRVPLSASACRVLTIKKRITYKYKPMTTIRANASGTSSIEISEEHLMTIERYSLFDGLVDSNGIVDESVLDKLKLTVRSLLESSANNDKSLLDLCLDVIYNNNMKALGLENLITLYREWSSRAEKPITEELPQ